MLLTRWRYIQTYSKTNLEKEKKKKRKLRALRTQAFKIEEQEHSKTYMDDVTVKRSFTKISHEHDCYTHYLWCKCVFGNLM